MRTLLHICCAPCANQCIDVLRTDGYEVTGLWYNPNIHPFTEYRARRNCLRGMQKPSVCPSWSATIMVCGPLCGLWRRTFLAAA